MPADLYDAVLSLQQLGIYEVILPFLLVFTISYGILQRVSIFGKQKSINTILALAIGLLFLQNEYLVVSLNRFLPNVSFIILLVIMFLLLVGIFAGPAKPWGKDALTVAFIFSIIAIITALSTDLLPGEFTASIFEFWTAISPPTRSLIVFIILILIVVAVISHEKEDKSKNKGSGFIENFMKGVQGQ